jgi:hypothetical protein
MIRFYPSPRLSAGLHVAIAQLIAPPITRRTAEISWGGAK